MSDTDLVVGIISFAVLLVMGILYIWAEHRARRLRPEIRIEHPAEIRKAA